MAGQPGFFDLSNRYDALRPAGDPLERLSAVVDFEVFRWPLTAVLRRSAPGKGGHPPFDPVLTFQDFGGAAGALFSPTKRPNSRSCIAFRSSGSLALALGWTARCLTRRRSGCSASRWSRPRRSKGPPPERSSRSILASRCSATRTRPITSSASPGLRGEVRLRSAKPER